MTWLESDKSDWIAKEFVLEFFNKASNADLFLGTTTGVSAGKIMNVFNFNQIPLDTLNHSLFIILNLLILKVFLH